MLRRVLIPGSPLLSALVFAKAEESADGKKSFMRNVKKPSDLPIYTVDR